MAAAAPRKEKRGSSSEGAVWEGPKPEGGQRDGVLSGGAKQLSTVGESAWLTRMAEQRGVETGQAKTT